jgi:hypothetical protein
MARRRDMGGDRLIKGPVQLTRPDEKMRRGMRPERGKGRGRRIRSRY